MLLALKLLYSLVETNWKANLRRYDMKISTFLFTATMIAGIILMSLQPAGAQEWRMLIDKNIFTGDQTTQTFQKNSGEENDWLATQTPLLKNTPITAGTMKSVQTRMPISLSEYSQIGSWAPLQSEPGKENFTLFSF